MKREILHWCLLLMSQDFKDLLAALHERGIKVIMDFIPNHSSDQHEWFKKSVKKEEPYTDFYVWREGTPGRPPTNWVRITAIG